MTSFYDEVEKYLELIRVNDPDMFSEMFYGEEWYERPDDEIEPLRDNHIKSEMVQHHGGEGEGEDFYSVWKFTRNDEECFVKLEGWYASYVGAMFQRMYQVAPFKEIVTVYR